jgi:hypothetical protein
VFVIVTAIRTLDTTVLRITNAVSVGLQQDAGLCKSCAELLVISDSSLSLSLQGLGVACLSLTCDSLPPSSLVCFAVYFVKLHFH